MTQRPIREHDGKKLLAQWLATEGIADVSMEYAAVASDTPLEILPTLKGNEWLLTKKLVVKPDQLIKRRGKSGLICLNVDFKEACEWIEQYRNKEITIGNVTGILTNFLIEPFLPHDQKDEYYLCLHTKREYDEILFHHEGGVDIGDVSTKAVTYQGPIDGKLDIKDVENVLLQNVPIERRQALLVFIEKLFKIFQDLHFSYLEINPLVYHNGSYHILDLAAKLDEAALFECESKWNHITFPAQFGRQLTPEESRVKDLDGKTGASLKLTILNPNGRIWLMVAGGGASVVYADTVAAYGYADELANYGEYSGAPNTQQTYDYAMALLTAMTKAPLHPSGSKILLIGGGIANFTDVAATFKGIIQALDTMKDILQQHNVKIYVRRGGPNYQEGLRLMSDVGKKYNLDIQVFGPEMHMTSIVPLSLGLSIENHIPRHVSPVPASTSKTSNFRPNNNTTTTKVQNDSATTSSSSSATTSASTSATSIVAPIAAPADTTTSHDTVSTSYKPLFTPQTSAIIYGLQPNAVQNMLDFDYINGRSEPSVKCLVYPFLGNHIQRFYWNNKEVIIPCLESLEEAMQRYPEVDCVINFASFRSLYTTTLDIMSYKQIRTIALIAEGVPERYSRQLIQLAHSKNITLIGPATVGGIKPGSFRIGLTGGMLDNIIAAKLYRPGSVAYVTRSGGLSNELNNILAYNSNGVYEGIAIGGDRYPGTTFIDHLIRYQNDPNIKIIVLLGEVGGIEEYDVCKMITDGILTKPLIAWCIGSVGEHFSYDVQFGHAGACAQNNSETATAKNEALKQAGAYVPSSFDTLPTTINNVYATMVDNGTITIYDESPPPAIPVDYHYLCKLGLVRKPAAFISTISDERGDELKYGGVGISHVVSSQMGLGGVIGLLWFRKTLPSYFCRFIELVLQLTADHGPAVSGAHNTIVTARAGKDMISSLCSGLLTIGPRFGGALDDAARVFVQAYDSGWTPERFLSEMHKQKRLIPGIGHKIKSIEDPDSRVIQLKYFMNEVILHERPDMKMSLTQYALDVEKLTTKKKSNLILNVDGMIAVLFIDIMRNNIPTIFTPLEVNEYLDMGILNGLFVIGRSVGFVGHWIDQKRLKQPLYRHPDDDISYFSGFY